MSSVYIYDHDFHEIRAKPLKFKNLLTLKPEFPSLADKIAEPLC